MVEYAFKALDALGIKFGPTHTGDFFVARILSCGLRLVAHARMIACDKLCSRCAFSKTPGVQRPVIHSYPCLPAEIIDQELRNVGIFLVYRPTWKQYLSVVGRAGRTLFS